MLNQGGSSTHYVIRSRSGDGGFCGFAENTARGRPLVPVLRTGVDGVKQFETLEQAVHDYNAIIQCDVARGAQRMMPLTIRRVTRTEEEL